jgi:hypothetical protein
MKMKKSALIIIIGLVIWCALVFISIESALLFSNKISSTEEGSGWFIREDFIEKGYPMPEPGVFSSPIEEENMVDTGDGTASQPSTQPTTTKFICDPTLPPGSLASNPSKPGIVYISPDVAEMLGLPCIGESNGGWTPPGGFIDEIKRKIKGKDPIKNPYFCRLYHELTHLDQGSGMSLQEKEIQAREAELACLNSQKNKFCSSSPPPPEMIDFCNFLDVEIPFVQNMKNFHQCLKTAGEVTETSCKNCMNANLNNQSPGKIRLICSAYCRNTPTDPPKCNWLPSQQTK